MIEKLEPGVSYTISFTQELINRIDRIRVAAKQEHNQVAIGISISFMAAIIKAVDEGGTIVLDSQAMAEILSEVEVVQCDQVVNSPAAKGSN